MREIGKSIRIFDVHLYSCMKFYTTLTPKRALILIAIPFFLLTLTSSCNQEEAKQMKIENDSLRKQLTAASKMVETMRTVNDLLDSIDVTRHSVRILSADDPKGGGSDYSQRMVELKDYVKQTEDKIRELEAAAAENVVNADSYMAIIDALKDELKVRNEEIGIMQENDSLNMAVNLKSTQLDDLELRLEAKKSELKSLQIQISSMVRTMKISQADSYFAQADALEEAARRTILAPNKKRATYEEALELYKKALKFGNKKAKAKVDELKAKLD